MKRTSYLFSLLFFMVVAVFTSCKDDGPDTPELTPLEEETALLADGAFTVTSVERSDKGTTIDLGGTPTLTFSESGAFSSTATGEFPDRGTFPTGGEWSFPSETSFNRIILSEGNVELTVVTLDENSLVFTYETSDAKSDGEPFVVTVNAERER